MMIKSVTDTIEGPNDDIERLWRSKGYPLIAGIDEAGRGPLAGPVVSAAVILDPKSIPSGLNDSKKLTERKRLALFETIIREALAVSVSSVSAETIDAINIRQATLKAMTQAALGLHVQADFCLIDGRDIPPRLESYAAAYIKGDGRSVSIAAASIVAKTMRDRMMQALPDKTYGFSRHMGYGSAKHRAAIVENGGIVRIHRTTFAPLKLL